MPEKGSCAVGSCLAPACCTCSGSLCQLQGMPSGMQVLPASVDLAPQRLHPAHVSLPAHQPFAWVSRLHESTLILNMHATLYCQQF